jgi:hypothetical protein
VVKDLNIRAETLKPVQERAGNTLAAIGIGQDFFSRTQANQQLRERMDKWNHMKLKIFCPHQKKWSLNWEKIFAIYTSDKELITRIYRDLIKLNSSKINVQ